MLFSRPIFRRLLLVAFLLMLLVLLIFGLGLYWVYRATQQVPEFYERALAAEPARQAAASDQMIERTTALAGDVKRPGKWRALFTEDQINGWLAVDLVKNHAQALPPEVQEPRVEISPEGLTIGFRALHAGWKTVLWLSVDCYVAEPNVLALRLKKARAGRMPVPIHEVIDRITQAAARSDMPLQWRQEEGDPVALLTIRPRGGAKAGGVRIESLEFRQGEMYLSGTTEEKGE